jgi:transcriptional regulator with XRE-family HTH domain
MAQLAYRIGAARVANGWTYSQLATRAGGGIRGPMIEGIEQQTRDAQIGTLVRIAKALDLHSFDALLGPMPLDELDPGA